MIFNGIGFGKPSQYGPNTVCASVLPHLTVLRVLQADIVLSSFL